MGLRGSSTVPLQFEDCRLPANALLGPEGHGFKLAMMALDGVASASPPQACGVARAALAGERPLHAGAEGVRQVGGGLPGRRFMLANIQTELAAAELMTLRAADLKQSGRSFTREASMAKVFASEMANRAADKAVQLHGGTGTSTSSPWSGTCATRECRRSTKGTSEIQRLVIARDLLKAAG
jgi:alkylation response protein AidB-like acyl-CoA dehydrogenase